MWKLRIWNTIDCFQGFPGGSDGKNLPAVWETWVRSLGHENPWRRERLPTPISLPGIIPWTEEPDRLSNYCGGKTAKRLSMTLDPR